MWPIFLRHLYKAGVALTPDHRLASITPLEHGNCRPGGRVGGRGSSGKLLATLVNEYSHASVERAVDHVVIEHGTRPVDDVYMALQPLSRNNGEIDLDALLAVPSRRQQLVRNEVTSHPGGGFALFRVGDAVSSRNVHAALYDSLRLCKDL